MTLKQSNILFALVASLLFSAPLLSNNSFSAEEKVDSFNEAYTTVDLHYLYKGFSRRSNKLCVQGPEYDRYKRKLVPLGNHQCHDRKIIEHHLKLANSVLRIGAAGGLGRQGTGFSVGPDLILTNYHVMSPFFSQNKKHMCKGFRASLPAHKRASYRCKAVYHCNKSLDYCLLEVKPHKRSRRLSKLTRGLALSAQNPVVNRVSQVISIGNPGGFGLQASRGRGAMIVAQNKLKHYSPTYFGSSGGPLFLGNQAIVYAINTWQSETVWGTSAYNLGVLTSAIVDDLEGNLDPSILSRLNISRYSSYMF